MASTRLVVRPIAMKDARTYIREHHRHNKEPRGGKWCLSVYDGDRLCGVSVSGRPVARALDDGRTLEITRVCTDGTKNACSILYGTNVRIAREMGYTRVVTYTLASEPGISLRAAGFQNCGSAGGGTWNCPTRPRDENRTPHEKKIRWEKNLTNQHQ